MIQGECPACQCTTVYAATSWHIPRKTGRQVFDYVGCNNCQLLFMDPIPSDDEVASYYGDDAYWWTSDQVTFLTRAITGVRRLLVSDIMFLLRKALPRGGRLLDVGCGSGLLLDVARNRGFQTTGIEQSEAAARFAQSRGLDVRIGSLSEQLQGADFDAITMVHVLEHVPDPATLLRHAAERMKPGGLLIVEVPNADSLGRMIFGKHWAGWEIPLHVLHFRKRALAEVLKRNGFAVVRVRHWSLRAPAIFARSLFSLLAPKLRESDAGWFLRLLAGFLSLPFIVAGSATSRGDVLVVVAERATKV